MKNNTMPPTDDPKFDNQFAYRIRFALDEQVAMLSPHTINRLSEARRIALARKKPESKTKSTQLVTTPCLAGIHKWNFSFDGTLNWLLRVGIVIPILVLVLGSIGIYYYEHERRINELAELDAAVLADDLPIIAYLDHGFDAYLNESGE